MARPIPLKPVRRDVPMCADYEDPERVVAFERAVRVHRAHSEPCEIVPPLEGIVGTWRVESARGAMYSVDLVDGSQCHDACTCPDFMNNGLSTCKHLEAVRRLIHSRKGMAAAFKRLKAEPSQPTLTVDGPSGRPLLVGGVDSERLTTLGLRQKGNCIEALKGIWPAAEVLEGAGIRVVQGAVLASKLEGARRQAEQRRKDILKAMNAGRSGVDVLLHPLFPYQETGVRHLVCQGRALLADDMGLGKTVQAIAACEVLRRRGEARSIFIVTPASLKDQWAREILRYTGEHAVVLTGRAEQRTEALQGDAPYKILNYELTWRELSRLRDLEPDVLVLDEAQRAKNFRTRTAETLRAIPSRFLFVLTGTPVENRLDDLYSLLQLVDSAVLGPLWRFNLEFHQQGAKGRVVGAKNLTQLRERIASVVLRRRKEEVLDQLPSLTIQTRYTALSPQQVELEEGYRSDASRYLALAERRALTPLEQKKLQACLLKARQACNALELCDPLRDEKASPKLDEFEALVSEIASEGGRKVLVFSEWVEMLKLAGKRLDHQKIGWAMLSGEVPTEKRAALLDRFREDPKIQVLLCSDAGGSGLNLQVASCVVHLDLPWNPARLDQRNARAHRLGQTRGVNVIQLCAEAGIERGIEGTLEGKRAIRSAALDADSDVESVEVQGFSLFLRQLAEMLEGAQEPETLGAGAREEEVNELPWENPAADLETPQNSIETMDLVRVESTQQSTPESHAAHSTKRAKDRLRLAKVVLEAGFAADALRAVYEALALAIIGRLDSAPDKGHRPLVAAIYRELVPTGRLPMAVPGLLARLHDLTDLEHHGVEPEMALVQASVEEAADWVERLSPSVDPQRTAWES